MAEAVEFDFITSDSLEALKLYERIFEVYRDEVTNLPRGQNEALFTIYGTRFHILDENQDLGLLAPGPGDRTPFWFNVTVHNIKKTYQNALDAGCTEIQAVTEVPDHGVTNAIFKDPYGYVWMLHQLQREVSFQERMQLWEDTLGES